MFTKRHLVARAEAIVGVHIPRPHEIRDRLITYAEAGLGGRRIVRPAAVGLLFEQIHLKRLFEAYSVDCVFDVGANKGQYAEMLRTKVSYKGPIISYEPNPEALEVLHGKASKDPLWHIVAAALDETAGRQTFNVMAGDQFSSLKQPTEHEVSLEHLNKLNKVVKRVEVATRTLAQEFGQVSSQFRFRHPYLKMDTQGHDIAVTKGGAGILPQFVGIQTEMAFKRLYEDAFDFAAALEFFCSQGFELSAIVPNNEGHFPQLIEVDGIFVRKDLIRATQ